MELLFPRLTDVLSTETPTQLAQGISFRIRISFIFSKMDAAVAEFVPETIIITKYDINAPGATNLWLGTCQETV